MTTHDAFELGRNAYKNDESSAPFMNAQIEKALEGRKVGDKFNTEIMRAFGRGYAHETNEALKELMKEVNEA
jgi:hypothetical protein